MSSGPVRLRPYNETLVKRVLDVLKPSPVDYSASTPMVWSTAKEFAGKADKKEKWYGTPYQASQVHFSCLCWSSSVVWRANGGTYRF